MAQKSSIYKVSLQVSDMDRKTVHDHALSVARHSSETEERLMVRLLAFARHADERLAFALGRAGGDQTVEADEPDLWIKDRTGKIELWIEVGLPDDNTVCQACERAKQVVVYAYGGRKADLWWAQNHIVLKRLKNLTVVNIFPGTTRALGELAKRSMKLNAALQDGKMIMGDGEKSVQVELKVLQGKP
jgi:uncharacterized protein YaeQ